MRDRVIRSMLERVDFTGLIPDDLNLLFPDQRDQRERYLSQIQTELAHFDITKNRINNLAALAAAAIVSILEAFEAYEQNLLAFLKADAHYEENANKKMQLMRIYHDFATLQPSRVLNVDLKKGFIKMVLSVESQKFKALESKPVVSQEDDEVKKLLKEAMSSALTLRSSFFYKMKLSPHVVDRMPDKDKLSAMLDNTIAQLFRRIHHRKWQKYVVRCMENNTPTLPVEDSAWVTFKESLLLTANFNMKYGKGLYDLGDDEQALLHFQEALRIQEQIAPRSTTAIQCYSAIADIYSRPGKLYNLKLACSFSRKSLRLAESMRLAGDPIDDQKLIYDCYIADKIRLGTLYYKEGMSGKRNANNDADILYWRHIRSKGTIYYSDALSHSIDTYGEESIYSASCYAKIGLAYSSLNQYAIALQYYLKAKKIHKKLFLANVANRTSELDKIHQMLEDLTVVKTMQASSAPEAKKEPAGVTEEKQEPTVSAVESSSSKNDQPGTAQSSTPLSILSFLSGLNVQPKPSDAIQLQQGLRHG